MQDKICLVTGATSGIGFESVKALSALGATVVAVARDRAKAAEAATRLPPVHNSPFSI